MLLNCLHNSLPGELSYYCVTYCNRRVPTSLRTIAHDNGEELRDTSVLVKLVLLYVPVALRTYPPNTLAVPHDNGEEILDTFLGVKLVLCYVPVALTKYPTHPLGVAPDDGDETRDTSVIVTGTC
jgi:hypothetical protein